MMKWCCPGFEAWYESADERGFGVVIDRDPSGKPLFLLQYRSVDRGVTLPNTKDILVTLLGRSAISYCPSCGRNLRRWYGKSIDKLRNAEPIENLREELS
jgi:hypothetical protein